MATTDECKSPKKSLSSPKNGHSLALNRPVSERISRLYNNTSMADLVFILAANKTLMAHKLILASGSTVFYQLFELSIDKLGLNMSNEDNLSYITLRNCPIDHFSPVIKYLYTDTVDVNDDTVIHVINWSLKLMITSLINRCLEYIGAKLNVNNCLHWWHKLRDFEHRISESQVMDLCFQTILVNAGNLFKSKDIVNLSLNELTELLANDDLNITESDAFNGAIRWAHQQCLKNGQQFDNHNLREALDKAFYKIRFPCMTSSEFGFIVIHYPNLFNNEELCSLIAYINSGVISKQMTFNTNQRSQIMSSTTFVMMQNQPNYTHFTPYPPIPHLPISFLSPPPPPSFMTSIPYCVFSPPKKNNRRPTKAVITDPQTGRIIDFKTTKTSTNQSSKEITKNGIKPITDTIDDKHDLDITTDESSDN
ncbi:BTB/POZ domain-containing protein 6-like [Oppia nitens]|uniref:BTB/POZ domain-containing protein 6-like n=1 Tax=Oppia nitens TaxID=1686743 RepID=UPI0023D9C9AB|nr:BTB/POZ domain-containing protein 6-like [Oppia nitens]